ncbi:cytochrome P450 2 sub U member 1 [Branchiostoma belcheri]|nr:cytochrome P450 2 sub U member 1 [Branchiostoma belcheri]
MAVLVGWIAESVQEILQISGLTIQSFLVFCTAFIVACFLLKPRGNLPPYPAGRVPVLGHLLALGRAPHLKLTSWRRQYGDVYTVRMGMEDVVVLNGYAAVKDALVDRSELFASRPPNYLADAMVGFGKDIAFARWGTEFRQRKRFATAVLKNLGMKGGTGSIEEKIREEASFLRNRRYDYRDETFRELSEAVEMAQFESGAGQIISVFPFLRFVPVVNRAGINALQEAFKIQNVLKGEISRHRENLDRENPRDFLDFCLLEVEKQEKVEGLTEEIVMYMAEDLFFAGLSTTTDTLRWSLLYMTLNPNIQNKVKVFETSEEEQALAGFGADVVHVCIPLEVQQELDAVVGEGLPTLSHRSQLPYGNACLLEVMRIRPVVPLTIQHAPTETVKVREYDIPKGTQGVSTTQPVLPPHDPAYWPDPDRFDPGRFLDAEGNVINKPESFMPFSGGRRVCLGEQLARMELFLFFSTLLQSFTFRTPEDAPPPTTDGVFGITLPPHPFKLCAIPLILFGIQDSDPLQIHCVSR